MVSQPIEFCNTIYCRGDNMSVAALDTADHDIFALIPYLVSVDTVSRRIQRTPRAVRGLIDRGRITAFTIGNSLVVYWPSVVKYYQKRGIKINLLSSS